MTVHGVQCDFGGSVFFGVYEIGAVGGKEVISVRFNGEAIEEDLAGRSAPTIATALLCDLVLRKSIGDIVLERQKRRTGEWTLPLTLSG